MRRRIGRRPNCRERGRPQAHVCPPAISFRAFAHNDPLTLKHREVVREQIGRNPQLRDELSRRQVTEHKEIHDP
ncbi:hypothetical protein GCM10027406_31160 [Leifsonia lichenia]